MEMLRSGFQAVGLSSGDSDNKGGAPSSAETIERLVSRLNTSTLLEDRRDACRALKGNSYIFNLATLTDIFKYPPLLHAFKNLYEFNLQQCRESIEWKSEYKHLIV